MRIHELSVSERIVLAEKLWDSIVDEDATVPLSEKQTIELDLRLQTFLDDQDFGAPWSEVKERISHQG